MPRERKRQLLRDAREETVEMALPTTDVAEEATVTMTAGRMAMVHSVAEEATEAAMALLRCHQLRRVIIMASRITREAEVIMMHSEGKRSITSTLRRTAARRRQRTITIR